MSKEENKQIYIVNEDQTETGGTKEVVGVFTTEQLAIDFAKNLKETYDEYGYEYTIDSYVPSDNIENNGYKYMGEEI